ncbi:hypothetical protein LA080_013430 [Diaporthe eres]|nr:hypothetical protein LA080_013430 [Diaporthe eres]
MQPEEDQQNGPYTDAKFTLLPTPPQSPPSALLAHTIQTQSDEEEIPSAVESPVNSPWQAAFIAGTKAAPIAKSDSNILNKAQIKRRLRQGSHAEMRSWTEIRKKDPRATGKQILDYIGDQQAQGQTQETYATTLAERSFRTLIAIATKFNLELIQYNVVNAFIHTPINQDIFMRIPRGYEKKGTILMLNKALYELQISPLLWQKEFTRTLAELRYQQAPHEPYYYKKNGILIFFYINDIVVAYQKNRQRQLAQTAYIEKIAKMANKRNLSHKVPITTKELKPRTDAAKPTKVNSYQRKIRLARFLTNPSQKHHDAADRVLLYLENTKHLALYFTDTDEFTAASDSSFTNNTVDQKSSQAFAMKLFRDEKKIKIKCDNTQTINLVNSEITQLKTKLRHMDIHNHWLRQEVQNGTIGVEYTPSAQMMADGLTKALPAGKWNGFLQQLGLEDINNRRKDRNLLEDPMKHRQEAVEEG